MLKKEIVDKISKILEKNYYRKENDQYVADIHAEYTDEFEKGTIIKIANSDNPRDAFFEQFEEFGYFDYEFGYLLDFLYENLEDEYLDNQDIIIDWVTDNVSFNLPYNHYLKQDILVNIIADTGDGDYDYTLNNFLNYDAPDVKDLEIEKASSILWLVKQQGYTKKDLLNVIKGKYDRKDKFLDSLYDELLNSCSCINALTFSVQMTLGDYMDLLENKSDIKLGKDTSCGLVNFWNGSGSLLNICLNKEVVIPRKFARITVDGGVGYSIQSIYGMMSSHWTETLVA